MKVVVQKNHRLVFYGLWLLLGLMQSGLTELQDDEAYYWVYSRFLDWGYFDHPPMIALLIKAGYAIFPNEMGVRFIPLLLNIFSLVIIEKLISKKNNALFYAIALSMAIIQLGGFVAVPDIPLIFFTALFFLCYKNFLRSGSFPASLLLGLSIALLLYSKYHGVLIVFFVLFSNLKLLKKYEAWLAVLVALLLFAPHLWWQYQHNWVSIRYHLFESNVNPYKINYTAEYIIGQFLLAGPFAGFILIPAAFLYRPRKQSENYEVEKALRYMLIGFYAFFLLSTFRGKVEANWTSPVLVPVIILSHAFLNEKARWRKYFFRLLPVSLVFVLLARIIMIVDWVPLKPIRERLHAWKQWPAELKEKTKGLPLVFSSSYQFASKYWFYSGQQSYSQNMYVYRRNNYNFWPVEDSLLGKPVYLVEKYNFWHFPDSIQRPYGQLFFRYEPFFVSFAKIQIHIPEKELEIKEGEELLLHCRYTIPPLYAAFIKSHPDLKDTTLVGFFTPSKWIKEIKLNLPLSQMNVSNEATIRLNPELPKGTYYLRLGIRYDYYHVTHNGEKIKLRVR